MSGFKEKYGPWALVAGGALGIGEEYSRYAARQGLNVVVLDREQAALDEISASLQKEFGVECLAVQVDLSADDMLEQVIDAVGDREIGLVVYNAGISGVGPFYTPNTGLDFEKMRIAVNVTGPMLLTYHFARPMLARRAGGILLMTSGTAFQGSPYYSAYAATRAYCLNLGQSLWYEFKHYDVDVLAVAAGLTLSSAAEGMKHIDAELLQTTEQVVDEAMNALGEQPLCIPGEYNRTLRKEMDQLSREEQITTMAEHPVTHFMGGKLPDQHLE